MAVKSRSVVHQPAVERRLFIVPTLQRGSCGLHRSGGAYWPLECGNRQQGVYSHAPHNPELSAPERVCAAAGSGRPSARIGCADEGCASIANDALRAHQRWEGSGYPSGLKGEGIPLSARSRPGHPSPSATGAPPATIRSTRAGRVQEKRASCPGDFRCTRRLMRIPRSGHGPRAQIHRRLCKMPRFDPLT
jgi:hypothetical protein